MGVLLTAPELSAVTHKVAFKVMVGAERVQGANLPQAFPAGGGSVN